MVNLKNIGLKKLQQHMIANIFFANQQILVSGNGTWKKRNRFILIKTTEVQT